MEPHIPTTRVAEYISGLARRHGVAYIPTATDHLAKVLTHLSDDDVDLDNTELLIIALERAGLLPNEEVIHIHSNYLHEKFGVRPL